MNGTAENATTTSEADSTATALVPVGNATQGPDCYNTYMDYPFPSPRTCSNYFKWSTIVS